MKDQRLLIISLGALVLMICAGILIYSLSSNHSNNDNSSNTTRSYCSQQEKEGDFCTEIYSPVCGWFNQTIQCIKYPCANTYSNRCFACHDKNVDYITEGVCPT